MPERGLHPVEGVVAYRVGDRRGANTLPDHGVRYGPPRSIFDKLRAFKDGVVGKLTGGLAGMARARKVEVVTGVGSFVDAHHIEVATADGGKRVVKFAKAIIAAGSQAVKLPFMPEDERVVDSTGALKLKSIPKRMLVVGGGIIGLEMATVYSTLGTRIDVVEMLDGLMQGADRDLVKVWDKMNAHRFDHVMLKTRAVGAKATDAGSRSASRGKSAWRAAGLRPGAGRRGPQPERQEDCADKAGVAVTERGFINVDKQMRTNVPHIFAIGDIVGEPMLAHKAVHEAPCSGRGRAGSSASSTHARSPQWPIPTPRWHGPARPRSNARPRASRSAARCSRGPRRDGRSPTAATRVSPS